MSQKQIVYREILKRGLPYLRKAFSADPLDLEVKNSLQAELEFMHNILISILEEGYVEHDFWFLNHQAKYFFANQFAKFSPNLRLYSNLVASLFESVPLELRHRLTWPGPSPAGDENRGEANRSV